MRWMLDTNACIRYLNGRSPGLKSRLDAVAETDVVVCSVVKAELFYGAARSRDPVRTRVNQEQFLSRFVSLAFDDDAAHAYGLIRAELQVSGQVIGPNDLLIAAIAVSNGVSLVTRNTEEFSRVTGLNIVDWEN
jgi:tRNA(fMet)-specific endonuclease VapC